MTIKITEQNGRILIRRWSYDPAKKRSMPTNIMSFKDNVYLMPETIPAEKIAEFDITEDEQAQYVEFYKAKKEESEKSANRVTLLMAEKYLSSILESVGDSDAVAVVKLEELIKASEAADEVKKALTAAKNRRLRSERNKSKKQT